jgi:hypothetical protein
MQGLGPDETTLVGISVRIDRQVISDPVSQRIQYLVENALLEMAHDESGWDTLFIDPTDELPALRRFALNSDKVRSLRSIRTINC